MAQPEQGTSGINRRPIILIFLLLCVLFVLSYTGRMGQLVVLNGEVEAKLAQLEETRQRQAGLEEEYAYSLTEQYTDEVARDEFGMSQDGDDLIVPVGPTVAEMTAAAEETAAERSDDVLPTWQQWWRLFAEAQG